MAISIDRLNVYLEATFIGASITEAADVARIGRKTIYDWRREAALAEERGETGEPRWRHMVDETTGEELQTHQVEALEGNQYIAFVIAERYADAAGMREDLALLTREARKGDIKAIAARMKMRRGYIERQEATRTRVELTGRDGGPVQTMQIDGAALEGCTDDELVILRAALAKTIR